MEKAYKEFLMADDFYVGKVFKHVTDQCPSVSHCCHWRNYHEFCAFYTSHTTNGQYVKINWCNYTNY